MKVIMKHLNAYLHYTKMKIQNPENYLVFFLSAALYNDWEGGTYNPAASDFLIFGYTSACGKL